MLAQRDHAVTLLFEFGGNALTKSPICLLLVQGHLLWHVQMPLSLTQL